MVHFRMIFKQTIFKGSNIVKVSYICRTIIPKYCSICVRCSFACVQENLVGREICIIPQIILIFVPLVIRYSLNVSLGVSFRQRNTNASVYKSCICFTCRKRYSWCNLQVLHRFLYLTRLMRKRTAKLTNSHIWLCSYHLQFVNIDAWTKMTDLL